MHSWKTLQIGSFNIEVFVFSLMVGLYKHKGDWLSKENVGYDSSVVNR